MNPEPALTHERMLILIGDGETAYWAGKPPEANPYSRGRAEHGYWFKGWAQGADSNPKERE